MKSNQNHLIFNPQQHQRIEFDSRKYRHAPVGKTSYSPGYWKNYLPNDLARNNDDAISAKNSLRQGSPQYLRSRFDHLNLDESSSRIYRREEQIKKKQDIMRRVKELQEKVLPMVENDAREQKQEYDFAWQARMEQKIIRLESFVDGMRKEMQINMEKRLMEIENRWESKFNELYKSFQHLL